MSTLFKPQTSSLISLEVVFPFLESQMSRWRGGKKHSQELLQSDICSSKIGSRLPKGLRRAGGGGGGETHAICTPGVRKP